MAKGEKEPLPVYELRPPEWLPTAHTSSDIGYIGFYPPRPNDVEETLTEANVKHGLVLKPEVLVSSYLIGLWVRLTEGYHRQSTTASNMRSGSASCKTMH